ncbi:ATP-binding protein [Oleidesulfovibrio sp.]|uniref:ATP-binding protein n=1 Tax=Oleidesulfovibrio sp. TaxID=2909707 RepID=UPI003A847120
MQHSHDNTDHLKPVSAGDTDDLLFAPEDVQGTGNDVTQRSGCVSNVCWTVLVVDDEEEVHRVTRMVLNDFSFEGKQLELLYALSANEAMATLSSRNDIAVILLDVVMETPHAGLEVARRVREELNNSFVRIILRTGQPGLAPEQQVISELDINDYRQKSDLSAQTLATSVTTALRSYRDLLTIEDNRSRLAQLALGVAHHIRNRTMSIAGFSRLILRGIPEDSHIKDYLVPIVEEATKLESLVHSVSDFAAVTTGPRKQLDLGQAVKKAVEAFKQNPESGGSSRSADNVHWKESYTPAPIVADPDLLIRLIAELLGNALNFAPQAQGLIEIRVIPTGKRVFLHIRDNGPGIKDSVLPFVFDPLYSTLPEASGMGLCLARRIATEHHWDIALLPQSGGGTEAVVSMPVCTFKASQQFAE